MSETQKIALHIFGTIDYESMLEILPPYDGMVRQFNKERENINEGEIIL